MTIEVNDRRKEWLANGVTTQFIGPRALEAAHIAVYVIADRVSTLQESGYTLTGVGRSSTTVTFDDAPADGRKVLILRTVPYEQACDISNQGAYLPETVENSGLDPIVQQTQQLDDRMSRVLMGDETSSDEDWNFDAQGRRIVNLGDGIDEDDAVNLGQMTEYVEGVVANGSSIEPVKWEFTGDGVTTDFPIPGADVESALFFDTAIAGVVMEPLDDFDIIIGADPNDSLIRFAVAPANLAEGFTIMRAFASPYVNENTGRVTIVDHDTTALDAIAEHDGALIVADNVDAIAVAIHEDDLSDDDFAKGSYFSVMQRGVGAVTITLAAGTLVVPAGFNATTRGVGSIITATRITDGDVWVLSGDLLVTP